MSRTTIVVTYSMPYQGNMSLNLCGQHADTCRYLGEVRHGSHLGVCEECESIANGIGHMCGLGEEGPKPESPEDTSGDCAECGEGVTQRDPEGMCARCSDTCERSW